MKEKTAEEMFKELGLKKLKTRPNAIVYVDNSLADVKIVGDGYGFERVENRLYKSFVGFDLQHREYEVFNVYLDPDGYEGEYSECITPALHQAITKQIQELGWI